MSCPTPSGTKEHFNYEWYIGSMHVHSGRQLIRKVDTMPEILVCKVTNRLTKTFTQYTVRLFQLQAKEETISLWVILPGILIIIIIPLVYMAYLKLAGELDNTCCYQRYTPDDDVDYVVTQLAESSSSPDKHKCRSISLNTAKPGILVELRKRLREMSAAVNKVASRISTRTSAISLPMTASQTKIKESIRIRRKRAEYLKEINITSLFMRPHRRIRRQSEHMYGDEETKWIAAGIRKVDNWQKQLKDEKLATSHSKDTIEDTMREDEELHRWKHRLLSYQQRLIHSDIPCDKETWLGMHRGTNTTDAHQFNNADISKLSKRLMDIFKVINPNEEHFPQIRSIRDPFYRVLVDPHHEHHKLVTALWDEYMETLFATAACVNSSNKLSRRVLEYTMAVYGKPEKFGQNTERREPHKRHEHVKSSNTVNGTLHV